MGRVVLLCVVAGFVDAFGYVSFGHVFAANMTGTSVLLSISAAGGDWGRVAIYAAALAAFLAGAFTAGLLKHVLQRPYLSLLAAGALLAATPLAVAVPLPAAGAIGPLMLLAAAMGLQGAALNRFGSVTLPTIVITGAILRLADGLVGRLSTAHRSGAATAANEETGFAAAAWLTYAVGGALGVGGSALGTVTLLAPALLLAGLGLRMAGSGLRLAAPL